ncbi:ammonium transporter (TC 1.A.11) [Parasporobacterium paucivorans DSM 15970]|uniref:Ammonium transporter n=1 Tax=Parasporobacterium paucivorans DSM 15970 TaxID=1122934 RepID=A0A1M6J7H3_9FIRM|nr:ammonium transporter [Parasporobacterium paucivorans]SHJ42663.1 ammonium transporter (TC 1.A.11) [Parasporobacterium paucivorans DSM 15970]
MNTVNTGDTAFMLIATAMVLFMTPGLAFFYGGLVQRKNVLNTMVSSIVLMGIATALWIFVGYSVSFSGDIGGIIGNFDWTFMRNVSADVPGPYSSTISNLTFAMFQMMFAVITPAIITGAVAGRMNFKALLGFVVLWSLLVYYPLAHMVWGAGGFMGTVLGSVDFAGGNVVHISSGVSGLVLSIILGKRRGYNKVSYRTHNIPFVILGASILWFGWFAFNAGSALGASGLAVHAFMTTNTSAAFALLSWMVLDMIKQGKPTAVGAATGGILGLVAITPGAGFVPIWAAIIIGILVSPICYFSIAVIKKRFGYDDALDAFGCHGIGGIWGGLATGIFTDSSINGVAKWNGLIFGEHRLFVAQVLSILLSIAVSIVGTVVCAFIVKIFVPLRVSEADEKLGLDMSQHGESAYPAFNGLD